jgi:hypothetical protein
MIYQILTIFIIGIIILVGAIIINSLATYLSLTTWFSFIESISQSGFLTTLKEQSILSLLFLFIIYPLLLGLLAWLGFRYIKF